MGYSPYIQWVVTIFMNLFGVNFNAYYFIFLKEFKKAFSIEEVRCYFLIIFISTAIIFLNILQTGMKVGDCFRHAAFQVGSIITSTGFATADFNLWPETSRTILVLLMFIGACAGSTGGGIKVSRIVILFRTMLREFHKNLYPNRVKKVHFEGRSLDNELVRSVSVFLGTYAFIFAGSVLLIAVDNFDMITNFTAFAATFNNIGPGLALVGPTQNFSLFSNFSKLVLIFDMLAGRLELYPMLLLFARDTWRKF